MQTDNGKHISCAMCGGDDADNLITMTQVTDSDIISDTHIVCDDCYNKVGDIIIPPID